MKMENIFDHYKDREENTITLANQSLELQNDVDNQEENRNFSQVSWFNLAEDEDRCKIITGFTTKEFLNLYDVVADNIEENIGRGPRSKIDKHNRLVMTLCYLKHYETIDKMKDNFSISRAHLHTILITTIAQISDFLYNYYVIDIADRIKDEEENDIFLNVKYVIDVTFQSIWTPTGTYDEKKLYFSGKHKLYGLKSQCIHDRKGRVVHCIAGERGAMHDLTICRENIHELKDILRKNDDGEEGENKDDDYWFVMADSAYKGLQDETNVMLPHKKKPNKQLTKQQQKFNRELAAERVICERFYGRLKTRYRIMSTKYRNSRDDYEMIFKLCAALTNYHILSYPL